MRTILAVLFVSLLLSISSGCAATRGAAGGISHDDWHATNGEYRPWNDVNSGGLPPMRWFPRGGPAWSLTNSNTPNYALAGR